MADFGDCRALIGQGGGSRLSSVALGYVMSYFCTERAEMFVEDEMNALLVVQYGYIGCGKVV